MVWRIPDEDQSVYLTFDDGPTAGVTPWVLDALKSYNAKATFFCIGKNVETNPEIYNRILAEGHQVGNHTFNHLKGWKSSVETYLEDVQKASNVIVSKLFRPPYGKLRPKQISAINALNYSIIMWNEQRPGMRWGAR